MTKSDLATVRSPVQGLRHKHIVGAFFTAGMAVLASVAFQGAAHAQNATVGAPNKSFPESVTSTSDGTLYFGSFNLGGVTKAAPGKQPEQFIKPGTNGTRSTFGVLADEKTGSLYVCSNDLSALGVDGPGDSKGAWLKSFDLRTGELKGSFKLLETSSLCNDITLGTDGAIYVTDSLAPNVYRLKPGGTALEVFATDPVLAPAKGGVGLDGIAFGPDGNLYVTTFIPAKLFRIAVSNATAGAVTELKPSRSVDHPDALRTFKDGLLLVEGAGRLDKLTVKGDEAQVEVIKDGLAEPVSVTQVGDVGWVAEGKLSFLIGDNRGKDPGSFAINPVSLPK